MFNTQKNSFIKMNRTFIGTALLCSALAAMGQDSLRLEEVLVTATRAKNNASTTFKNLGKEAPT